MSAPRLGSVLRRRWSIVAVAVLTFGAGGLVAVVAGGTPVPVSPLTATVGQAVTGTVGRFDTTTCPCTASIEWGDRPVVTSAGTVEGNSDPSVQSHAIVGAHTYTDPGVYTITVRNTPTTLGAAPPPTETATTPVTVVTAPPPPPPPAPTAGFAVAPTLPLAGQAVTFDAGASTGSGLTYAWKVCQSQPEGHAKCADAGTGVTVAYTFPGAQATDTARLNGKRKPQVKARRATYSVALTVTDSAGQTTSVSHLVTVMPDTLPIAGFDHDVTDLPVTETGLLTSTATDPDKQDAIVEERWDVSGDGVDDLVCLPFKFCTILPGAGGLTKPRPKPDKLDLPALPRKGPGLDGIKAITLPEIAPAGGPVQIPIKEGVDPGDLGTSQLGGVTLQSSVAAGGGRAVRVGVPKANVNGAAPFSGKRKPGTPPLASLPLHLVGGPKMENPGPQVRFPSLTVSFYAQRLAQVGLPPFEDLDFAHATGSSTSQDKNTAAALYDYGKTLQDAASPEYSDDDSLWPWQVRQTVKDSAGGVSSTTLPISFQSESNPRVDATYLRPAGQSSKPLAVGTRFGLVYGANDLPQAPATDKLSVDGTKDKQGPITWYVLGLAYKATSDPQSPYSPVYTQASKDARTLNYTFAKVGYYRISLIAYDSIGLGAKVFISPVYVSPASGDCVTVAEKVGPISVAGDCVTIAAQHQLFVAKNPITINGVTLAPASGGAVVIDNTANSPAIFSTTDLPSSGDLASSAAIKAWAAQATAKPAAATFSQAGVLLGQEPSLTTVSSAILGLDTTPVTVADGAAYNSLPIAAGSLSLSFASGGQSTARFKLQMPAAFGDVTSDEITLSGQTQVKEVKTVTQHTTGLRAAAAKKAPKGWTALATSGPVAHAAASPPDFLLPNPASLGPIKLPGGMTFSYDDVTGTWHGSTDIEAIPGVPGTAHIEIVIKGTTIVSISGSVSGQVPLAPGVLLTNILFGVTPDPSDPVITGGAGVTVAELLDGTGQITVHPTQPRFRFDGNVSLLGFLPLGSAYLDYGPSPSGQSSIAFGGQTGYDFGPASFHSSVNGAMTVSKPFHFFLEGDGEACLFACLDTHVMVSDLGVAACGEIDLFFDTISAGIGYRFGQGLDVFVGSCDLSGYKPAGLRAVTRSGSTRAVSQLAPGQTTTIPVKGDEGTLAIAVHGQTGSGDGPHVTLKGPAGDKRVITTSTAPGDYAFSGLSGLAPASLKPSNKNVGTALVDDNPLNATTTILLSKPTKGNWMLSVDPDSTQVTGIDLATQLPPIPKNAVDADVTSKVSGKAKIAVASVATGLARNLAVSKVPSFERSRLRTLSFKLAKGVTKVAFLDKGPKSSRLMGQPTTSGEIAFDPAADPGRHTIEAVFFHPNGLPRDTRTVATYVAPGPPKPQRPTVTKMVRSGSTLKITLDKPVVAPDVRSAGLRVVGTAAKGTRIDATYSPADAAKHASGYVVTVKGLPKTGKVGLTLTGVYGSAKSASVKVNA